MAMAEITPTLAMEDDTPSGLLPPETSPAPNAENFFQTVEVEKSCILNSAGEVLEDLSFRQNIQSAEEDANIRAAKPDDMDSPGNSAGGSDMSKRSLPGTYTVDAKEREWIQVPSRQEVKLPIESPEFSAYGITERHCGEVQSKHYHENDDNVALIEMASGAQDGSLIKNTSGSEQAEWVSVEVPSQVDAVCSFPCSLVEWVTVEMPSQTGQASIYRSESEMHVSEHVCVRFSETEQKPPEAATIIEQKAAAVTAQACASGAPRTRKRRTISGKIRARIEAFENTFRQELDRLNSPLAKVKSRRIHEGLRRGAAAVVGKEECKTSEFEALNSLCRKHEPERPDGGALMHSKGEENWLINVEDKCLSTELEEGMKSLDLEPEKIEDEVLSHEQTLTEVSYECTIAGENVSVQKKPHEEDEWELTGKGLSEASAEHGDEEHEKAEDVSEAVAYELGSPHSTGGICVGGLVKQVISGAALLAGLIFLWPRGNNLIWRAPQKKQRYCMVKQRTRSKEAAFRPQESSTGRNSGLNLDCFKG